MLGGFFKNTKTQSAPPNGALLDSERFKQANEALYKQGAELAARNKTLSLLDRLNTIATHGNDVGKTAQQLSQEMIGTFEAPYVAILFYDAADKSLSLAGYTEKQAGAVSFARNVRVTDKKYPGFKVLRTSAPLTVAPNGTVTSVFFPKQDRKNHLLDIGVIGTFMYPLSTEHGPMGILIIGLNRSPDKLSAFERDSIRSAVNVISIAIDKISAYTQLRLANARLKELDEQKTDFLSIASHQLRTPLTIFKGFLELLEEGGYGKPDPEMLPIFANMDIANERLIKMIDNFLDISRIEQGRTKYDFKMEDLAVIITEAVEELKPRAAEKQMTVVWQPDIKLKAKVNLDHEKIRHVVFNFIDNAIKYSDHGAIVVRLEKEDGGLSVRVIDEGLGFEKLDESRFFQKFFRGENVKGVNVTGTGIGLFVCRKFIEEHKGRVWAKSAGIGKGSEFGFWIPVK